MLCDKVSKRFKNIFEGLVKRNQLNLFFNLPVSSEDFKDIH